MDLQFAEKLGKAFEAKFPGIAVRVERSGAERVFTAHRPGVFAATSTPSTWSTPRTSRTASSGSATAGSRPTCRRRSLKHYRQAVLRPRRPARDDAHSGLADRLQHRPGEEGGRAEELRRPARSEMDGQDGQGASGLQRHHHERDLPDRARLGWEYLREARQAEASCRCSRRPIRRRRSRSASAPSWSTAPAISSSATRRPASRSTSSIRTEGTPLATGPSAVFKAAPNPNAARLFQNWMHSREGQQILVDWARQYSPHDQTVEKPGVRKLADIKLMKEDPAGVLKKAEADQERATRRFSVCNGLSLPRMGGLLVPSTVCSMRAVASTAPLARRRLGFDLSKPVLLGFRGGAVRADRDAAVVAGLLRLHRQERRVHARQFPSAGVRRGLSRSAGHHLYHWPPCRR